MAKTRPMNIQFPLGGLSKKQGFEYQQPFTTNDCNNVWPTQWETGRARGGTRPGITNVGNSPGGSTPVNWARASWVNSASDTTYRGVAVACSNGVAYTSTTAGNWDSQKSANSSSFISCAVYLQNLFIASSADEEINYKQLRDGNDGLNSSMSTEGTLSGEDNPNNEDPWLGAGIPPQNCGLIITWGDRLVVAGDVNNPHVLYMCRIGNPNDWDYSAVDASAAWSNAGGVAGQIGEPITALIAHNRDCCLVGGTDSLYVVRGNPASNGQVYQLSPEVGPLMQSAWCKLGDDSTVFLTRDGLYSMRPGCGEPPSPMGREQLPNELVGINPSGSDTVSLGYDGRWRGVHIYATISGVDSAWFYDLMDGGYWPMSFSDTIRLAVNLKSESTAKQSGLLPVSGSKTYQYDLDSTESISSYLFYGPIKIGTLYNEGVLSQVNATLSEDSGKVAWSVWSGDSATEAKTSKRFTGNPWELKAFNYAQNPMVRGSSAYLKVGDSQNSRWSIESISAIARLSGRRRVG